MSVAAAYLPPARARIKVLPADPARAVVLAPVVGATDALLVSLESQTNETFGTSNSTPSSDAYARASKLCDAPISIAADSGTIAIREMGGDPKGVPSVRVPGEKVRVAASVASVCAMKSPPIESKLASGERVKD